MRIIYDGSGTIITAVFEAERFPLSDTNSVLEIDEIAANKSIIIDVCNSLSLLPSQNPYTVIAGELYKNGVKVILTLDVDKSQIKTEYINMIQRLEQIQNSGAIPFTQAGFNQVVQAVKDEALYIERVMKVIKSLVT